MINPLELFKSQNVYSLLKDFYKANFAEYGADESTGKDLVDLVWNQKDKMEEGLLRKEADAIFLNTRLLESRPRKEISPIDLFDLSKVENFLDVGANKLSRINELTVKYPTIKTFTAIDVVPKSRDFKDPSKSTYIMVDPKDTEYPIESNSCDFINIEFVLHHFLNEEIIKSQIKTFKRILKLGGQLLLWEETFEENPNIKELADVNNSLNILTNYQLTKDFYDLTASERWEFIIVNDWIINVNIDHMQWTGQWKEWERWVDLFKSEGFVLEKKYNLGLRVNGRLKQGVHILGLFSVEK